MLISLRNAFISGLLLLAPVVVTVFVIQTIVGWLGGPTTGIFFWFVSEDWVEQRMNRVVLEVLSTLYVVLLIALVGYISRLFIGKMVVQWAERVITSIPFASTVYNTVKQIVQTISEQQKAIFQEVVLTEWPQKGNYVIAFLTGEGKGEVQHRTSKDIVNLFIPTTPNPTSGYLIMVPRENITPLDMTVADGMKLIISGGAVVPKYTPGGGSTTPPESVVTQNPVAGTVSEIAQR